MVSKEKINILQVVPFRKSNITTETEGNCVTIAFPRFKRGWMNRFLLPKGMKPEIRIHLEEHGTAVWELIDGKRNVGEIIEKLADHFGKEEGYESRITTYILQLQKDGLIKLGI